MAICLEGFDREDDDVADIGAIQVPQVAQGNLPGVVQGGEGNVEDVVEEMEVVVEDGAQGEGAAVEDAPADVDGAEEQAAQDEGGNMVQPINGGDFLLVPAGLPPALLGQFIGDFMGDMEETYSKDFSSYNATLLEEYPNLQAAMFESNGHECHIRRARDGSLYRGGEHCVYIDGGEYEARQDTPAGILAHITPKVTWLMVHAEEVRAGGLFPAEMARNMARLAEEDMGYLETMRLCGPGQPDELVEAAVVVFSFEETLSRLRPERMYNLDHLTIARTLIPTELGHFRRCAKLRKLEIRGTTARLWTSTDVVPVFQALCGEGASLPCLENISMRVESKQDQEAYAVPTAAEVDKVRAALRTTMTSPNLQFWLNVAFDFYYDLPDVERLVLAFKSYMQAYFGEEEWTIKHRRHRMEHPSPDVPLEMLVSGQVKIIRAVPAVTGVTNGAVESAGPDTGPGWRCTTAGVVGV